MKKMKNEKVKMERLRGKPAKGTLGQRGFELKTRKGRLKY